MEGADYCVFRQLHMSFLGREGSYTALVEWEIASGGHLTIENCYLEVWDKNNAYGLAGVNMNGSPSIPAHLTMHHCTIAQIPNCMWFDAAVRLRVTGGDYAASSVTIKNCSFVGCQTGIQITNYTPGAMDISYTATSDGTADDWGGDGDLVNQSTDVYADYTAGDYRPAKDGHLHDAAAAIDGIDTDITGGPRSSGAAPDIGAWELQESARRRRARYVHTGPRLVRRSA